MPTDFLHIAYHPNKFWAATLAGRVRESSSPILRGRIADWDNSPLREMCLAIATKLAMMDQVVARIDRQLVRLGGQMSDQAKVETCLQDGAAYAVRDNNLPYEILVDVDSFLFESRSAYEIVGQFLRDFFRQVLGRSLCENELKTALTRAGIDTRWIDELRKNRILFFHETAPWIAARVASKEPPRFELIVLKKDVQEFTNPDDYIEFEQLREIYRGFRFSQDAIHIWVLAQIEEFEKNEAAGGKG